jgi:hypothetical protein
MAMASPSAPATGGSEGELVRGLGVFQPTTRRGDAEAGFGGKVVVPSALAEFK